MFGSEAAESIPVRSRAQILIGLIIDILIDEPHGTIDHHEMGSPSMIGLEAPGVVPI